LSSCLLFDIGKKQGHSSEQIAGNIRPLAEALVDSIVSAPVGECALAIKLLESQLEAHAVDEKFIQEKMDDCKVHIDNIKNSLINKMNENKKISMIEDGYSLTLIDGNLNIR
jgi:hypothetical protein